MRQVTCSKFLQLVSTAHYIATLLSPFYSVCRFVKDEFKGMTAKPDPAIYAVQISAECFLRIQEVFQVDDVQCEKLTTD